MATSTIFNFNFNNSEIVDSTGQWYNATTGTPTTEFIEHDGNTALLQRAYIAETSYTRDINPVFFQSRDPTFTAHTYTIELQIYPLRDSGGFGPWDGPVLEFNTESDEEGWVVLRSVQRASISNTFYWYEYGLSPDGTGIPFLTVTAADGTYNRWYSIRIERVDDGTNTGATIKIYVDGALVVNETITYPQDARKGRIGNSIRYTYRRNSRSPMGAGVAIDNFKLTAGIAPSSVVDVSLANLQRNNANLLSFIKGKVPTVNDGTLTIQKNGTNVATFTANQSTNATANITVPTKTSDLTNDSNFVESSDLATVATSGSYNDLSNKPTIPTVNNATLTIQRNGTTVDTFTANASVDKTININTADDTKIPLAGSNAISGSLIPATDNSIDIGSSTKNIKMLYTKGIAIDGKTVDTDANGNMTYDGHIVDTIEEQGKGYIRYAGGIQICWGQFGGIPTTPKTITFQKPFLSWGDVAISFAGQNGPIVTQLVGWAATEFLVNAMTNIDTDHTFVWHAVGRWK